jgi:hypothetical protein
MMGSTITLHGFPRKYHGCAQPRLLSRPLGAGIDVKWHQIPCGTARAKYEPALAGGGAHLGPRGEFMRSAQEMIVMFSK